MRAYLPYKAFIKWKRKIVFVKFFLPLILRLSCAYSEKQLYMALYMEFIPWIGENEFNLKVLLNNAKQNRISAFAWLDVIVSVVDLFI